MMNVMGDAARKLLDEALTLSEEESELLALDLLASLETRDPDWERVWTTEIDRRLEDVRSGRVETVAWEDVQRDLLARLGSR